MSAADRWVDDASGAHAVAEWIQDPLRVDTVVVVSLPPGGSESFFDLTALRQDVGGLAEIIILATGAVTRGFAGRMPAQAGVYGGGARVYPPVLAWAHDLSQAPLWLTRSRGEAAAQYPHLIRAVHAAVGDLHNTGALPPARAVARYAVGDVVLAKVSRVSSSSVEADLYPGLAVAIPLAEATLGSDQTLNGTFTPGQVIRARILSDRPWQLSLDEATGAAPVLAPPLVLGGPPWIELPRTPDEASVTSREPAPTEPWRATPITMHRPRHSPVLPLPESPEASPLASAVVAHESEEILALRSERDAAIARSEILTNELLEAEKRCLKASSDVQSLRDTLTEKTTALRKLRKQRDSADQTESLPSGTSLFNDAEQAFRFDIYLSWATRYTPHDKEQYPLHAFEIGPDFLMSLEATEGIERGKVVDVCTEVLTGRAKEHSSHAPKPYRSGATTHSPQHRRAQDGALAYRVHLQNNTPAARRLHYWLLPDRRIELWSVAAHDDHTF